MMFPEEAPRAVGVVTAAAAAAALPSPHPPRPHRAAALRVKARSRLQQPPPFRTLENKGALHRSAGVDAVGSGASAADPASSSLAAASASCLSAPSPERRPAGARDDRFERIRAKLMNHLREAAGRFELPATASREANRKKPVKDMDADDDDEEFPAAALTAVPANHVSVVSAPAAAVGEELPWNLRTRRSTAAAATSAGRHDLQQPNTTFPAPRPTHATSRPRSGPPEMRETASRRRRPRFSLPLTKEEIDEDLYAFTGRRAPRRPKKRPRAIQKQLDMLFPGLWLSEVTVETYQVADAPPPPPPPPS